MLRRRRIGSIRIVVVVAMCIAVPPSTAVATAQERDRVGVTEQDLDFADDRLKSFSPRSGPPGTIVELRASDMPPLAPLRIGVGALRFGFEEAGWVLADDDGVFTTEIEIPAWARYDVVHLFIVFDPYFSPVALSDVFHVTDSTGNVQRRGHITDVQQSCPILRGPDRVRYALSGDLDSFRNGDEAVVEGPIIDSADCPNVTTIQIVHITPADSNQ